MEVWLPKKSCLEQRWLYEHNGCVLGELRVASRLTSFAVFTVPEQLSCGIVTAKKPLSQHGRAVTFDERDVLRENEGRRNVSDGLKV